MKLKKFLNLHKFYLLLLLIIIVVAVVSGYVAFVGDERVDMVSEVVINKSKSLGVTNVSLLEPLQDEDIEDYNLAEEEVIGEEVVGLDVEESEVDFEDVPSTPAGHVGQVEEEQNQNIEPEEGRNLATFVVGEEEYRATFVEGGSVYEAMQVLSTMSINPFSFSGKEYSGMGFFVDEINGVKNDNRAGKYWIFYVNGESSKVGVSNYIIQNH